MEILFALYLQAIAEKAEINKSKAVTPLTEQVPQPQPQPQAIAEKAEINKSK